jgi:F-type H+-transporting ATPase subunit c
LTRDAVLKMDRNIALVLIFALCVLGPAFVMAAASFSSIGALGRNPSAAPKILTAMMITLIFAEAVAIVAFLVVWQLFAP